MEKYFVTQPRVVYVLEIDDKKHKGLLKVGDIFISNEEAVAYAKPEDLKELTREKLKVRKWAENLNFKIIDAAISTFANPGDPNKRLAYNARQIIDILQDSGYEPVYLNRDKYGPKDIWIAAGMDKIKLAIEAAKQNRKTIEGKPEPGMKPIRFRPEQTDAITAAIKKFSTKTGKKFLWNAKMRFGKTLSALEVARRLGQKDEKNPDRPLVKTILIVTHRPVVDEGWHQDFKKIFFDQLDLYSYGSRNLEDEGSEGDFRKLIKGVKNDGKRLVFFVSMQYLRLSTLVGGENDDPIKKEIMNYDWDMVVVDEAHEGTKTVRGDKVIKTLKKENTLMLSLSGTPFNLYDDFKEEEIYTWDYVKEQAAKAKWEDENYGDPNPYAELPHMNIFTFDLSKILENNVDEFEDFKFNEFFRTWTGEIKKDGAQMPVGAKGKFVHVEEVKKFLDLLVSAKEGSNYPFSTDEFREKFRHTFWIVPGVKEAKALEKLLEEHDVFGHGNFKIVNVAGEGNMEDYNQEALKSVRKAIENNNYTITLSCGKLTTGVSVPEWTAIFYLKGSEMTTAATYMQSIFRVQTHAVLEGEQKREAYVFDFAPSRALRVVAETSKYAARAKGSGSMKFIKGSQEEEKEELTNFLKFCPVISLDNGSMAPYKADKLFAQLKDVYVARAVQSGYADNSLYSSDSLIHLDEKGLKALSNIANKIGSTPNLPKPSKINVGARPMTEEEKRRAKEAEKKKREGKPLTPEEIEAREKAKKEREEKKARISVLRGISIRIPLLVYGAEIKEGHEDEELSIENFTTLVDQQSWDEFMPKGITKADFDAIRESYDSTVFLEAAKRIQSLTRAADSMDVEERIERIATIFSYFHNPDKETVLTPWRVVNMHMADTLGGWCFYNEDYSAPNVVTKTENGSEIEYQWPRFVDQGNVTRDVFGNYDARLLEINSKTGLYPLYLAYSLYRLWKSEYKKYGLIEKPERDDKVIWDSILKENLFVVCKTPMARAITRRTLVGFRKHDDGRQIQVNAVCPEWEIAVKDLVKTNLMKKDQLGNNPDRKVKCDLVTILRHKPSVFETDVVNPSWWERGGREEGNKDDKVKIKLDRKTIGNMIKFDAIVGNPPYQLNDGSGASDDASNPIYQEFIKSSNGITIHYCSLISPSKWMFGSKPALKSFRKIMMEDPHLRKIIDFENDREIFPNAHNDGGICYFLYDKGYSKNGLLTYRLKLINGDIIEEARTLKEGNSDIIIRDSRRVSIISHANKDITKTGISFKNIVHPTKPFGIRKDIFNKPERYPNANIQDEYYDGAVKIYGVKGIKGGARRKIAYIKRETCIKNIDFIDRYKLFFTTSFSTNALNPPEDIVAGPGEVCTETFLMIGPFKTEEMRNNCHTFFKTNFFKILLYFGRGTMQVAPDVFRFLPLPDFNSNNPDIDWNKSVAEIDQQLYKKYGLDQQEIDFIESMFKSMK